MITIDFSLVASLIVGILATDVIKHIFTFFWNFQKEDEKKYLEKYHASDFPDEKYLPYI